MSHIIGGEETNIYIVFSSTPYKTGRAIRLVTHNRYNHVSVALDSDLREMYSFARRYYNTPFWGGFVRESAGRFVIGGRKAQVKVCRIPLPSENRAQIAALLNQMSKERERYLYNMLSAMLVPVHVRVHIAQAYTCAEFAVRVLHTAGADFSAERFYTIKQMENKLEDYVVYEGAFPLTPEQNDLYYRQLQPFRRIFPATLGSYVFLARRLIAASIGK